MEVMGIVMAVAMEHHRVTTNHRSGWCFSVPKISTQGAATPVVWGKSSSRASRRNLLRFRRATRPDQGHQEVSPFPVRRTWPKVIHAHNDQPQSRTDWKTYPSLGWSKMTDEWLVNWMVYYGYSWVYHLKTRGNHMTGTTLFGTPQLAQLRRLRPSAGAKIQDWKFPMPSFPSTWAMNI